MTFHFNKKKNSFKIKIQKEEGKLSRIFIFWKCKEVFPTLFGNVLYKNLLFDAFWYAGFQRCFPEEFNKNFTCQNLTNVKFNICFLPIIFNIIFRSFSIRYTSIYSSDTKETRNSYSCSFMFLIPLFDNILLLNVILI